MSEIVPAACLSCGTAHGEAFCPKCGEKRITAHDYSVVHFFEHALETFTHFDYRSLRALKMLALKPGELTRAYLEGKRRRYVGPLQLFVILNVVFALIGSTTFRTPLFVQEHDPPFAAMKRAMVARAIEHSGLARPDFTREFDKNAGTQAKTWIFSMIPVFALFLAVIYGFRRYYFEHLVFATHFYAFLLLLILVAISGLAGGLRLAHVALTMQGFDNAVSLLILGALIVYAYLALRRAYGDGPVAAALRALAIGAVISPILLAYRFLLFFVTLKTMH